MTNYLLSLLEKKAFKYKNRLNKSLKNGTFQSFSRKRKSELVSKVKKFSKKLESMQLAKGTAIAGSIAGLAMGNTANAQLSTSFYRDSGVAPTGGLFSSSIVQIELGDLDGNGDLEILVSATNYGGRIIDGDIENGFNDRGEGAFNDMNDTFVIGDIDNDQDLDVIYYRQAGYLIAALNDGTADFTYSPENDYSYNGSFGQLFSFNNVDLELVDYDLDGDLDVLATNDNFSYISVFENDGTGQFESRAPLAIGGDSFVFVEFEVQDLDGDGDMDVMFSGVNATSSAYEVHTLRNSRNGEQGDPIFPDIASANRLVYAPYNDFENLTFADLDGDTDLDLFFTDSGEESYAFENNGAFDFTALTTSLDVPIPGSTSFLDVEVADFDDDGDDDLILTNYFDTRIAYLNGSDVVTDAGFVIGGTYSTPTIGDGTTRLSDLAVGDIDGDGVVDFVGLDEFSSGYVNVYLDRSAPYISGFQGEVIVDENSPNGTLLGEFAFTDIQGDNITPSLVGDDAALFSIDPATSELSVIGPLDWESTGSELDVSISLSDDANSKNPVIEIPVKLNNLSENGQGFLDPNGIVSIVESNNTSNFLAGDLDQDGDDDLVIGDINDPARVLFNTGVGLVGTRYGTYAYFKDAEFVDFDDDGDLDVLILDNFDIDAIGNRGDDFNKYFLGGGGVNSLSFGLTPGDFDDDGLEDVAVVTNDGTFSSFIKFELDDQNNNLTQEVTIDLKAASGLGALEATGRIVDLGIADFDGDGFEDALIVSEDYDSSTGNEYFFLGTPTGFSSTPTAVSGFQTDNGYNRIEIADFNNDGNIDIAAFKNNGTTIDIDIMINDGGGSFSVAQTLSTTGENDASGNDLTDMIITDMDGEGSLDIVSTTVDSGGNFELRMFLNDGLGDFSLAQTLSDFNGLDIEAIDIDKDDDADIMVREIQTDRDVFVIYLNANVAATNISLSSNSFDEHTAPDTQIATISVTDVNPQDTHVIYLADGDGVNDADENFFTIRGNGLFINQDVSFEDFPELNVLIAADDGENVYEQAIIVTVNDINQAPTAIALSSTIFDESTQPGVEVATISATDPNTGDTFVFDLAPGDGTNDADNDKFVVIDNQLVLLDELDFSLQSNLNINLSATDTFGESFTQAFTLTINEVLGIDNQAEGFSMYPNPGSEQLSIVLENELRGEAMIEVSDLGGKLVHQMVTVKNSELLSIDFDMGVADAGIYLVEINIGKTSFTKRWVKK